MNLLKLNINKILLLDEYNFNSPLNNIDYLNNQAALVESLEEKLKLLTRAAEIIEKFHSFFQARLQAGCRIAYRVRLGARPYPG